jgi:2,4-dienoyl-CoA reductase-like NADH-dependent reductase (Old Yellow Enzyme family)
LLWHRLFRPGASQGYFLPYSKALKKRLRIPIILVGGLRTVESMARLVTDGDADFIALSRPFIREPDLVSQIRNGRRGRVDCTSCNLCLDHEGESELMCWRKSKRLLAKALYERVFG